MRKSLNISVAIVLFGVITVLASIGGALTAWNQLIDWCQKTFEISETSLFTRGLLFFIAIALLAILTLIVKKIAKTSSNEKRELKEERERNAYLNWLGKDIENRFKSSLHRAIFIDLGLIENADAVEPWNFKHQSQQGQTKEFTRFDEVFDNETRVLLLGAPGSGKTTTLLKLAQKYYEQAQEDPNAGIPLLFNLSLWGRKERESSYSNQSFQSKGSKDKQSNTKHPDFDDWLIKMLDETPGTGVSKAVASKWIKEGKVVLLLDGFDEADETLRARLLNVINDYLQLKPNVDMTVIICSRLIDYEALVNTTSTKFLLDTAVILQPLTEQQIENYIDAAKTPALHKMIAEDDELKEMAQTPLNLSLMVIAYGRGDVELPKSDGQLQLNLRRHHLFETFIDEMMQRQARRATGSRLIPDSDYHRNINPPTEYSREQVNRYLGWLSSKMSQRSRTSFRLNNLYNFLLEHDSTNDRVKTLKLANNVWAFFLIFTITLIASPNENFLLNIGEGLAVGSIILLLTVEIPWAGERFEDNESILNMTLLFVPLSLIIVPFSVFIFGGLNTLFPGDIVIGILFIIAIYVLNYLVLREELLDFKSLNIFVCVNIYNNSSILFGLLYIRIPDIHISIFLTGIAIGFVIFLANKEYIFQKIFYIERYYRWKSVFNITLAGLIGATVGCFLHYSLIFILHVSCLVLAIIFKNHIEWLPGNLLGSYLTRTLMIIQGYLPWCTDHFFKYACKTLLLKESAQGHEFIHRRLRDHFALRDLTPRLDTLDTNQKLEVIKEMLRTKDASCDVLLELISDDNKKIRMLCIKGLGENGSALAGKKLLSIINETFGDLQDYAINQLEKIKDVAAVPMFVETVNTHDKNSSVAGAAFLALYKLKSLDKLKGISELYKMLDSNNQKIRYSAAKVLLELQETEAIPAFMQMLKTKVYDDRKIAIKALVKLKAVEIVPELIDMLSDDDLYIRNSGVQTLIELNAKEAIPFLMKKLKEKNNNRSNIIKALVKLKAVEIVPELIDMLSDDDLYIRNSGVQTLIELNAKEAIPFLMKKLKEKNNNRSDIIKALVKLKAVEIVPELIDMISDDDLYIRNSGVQALIELNAKEAIPFLMEILKDKNRHDVRSSTIEALAKLNAKEAIPFLMKILKNEKYSENIRKVVIINLGKLNALDTIPELLDMFQRKIFREEIAFSLKAMKQGKLPKWLGIFQMRPYSTVENDVVKIINKLNMTALLLMLYSDNSHIQFFAAKALVALQSTEVIPELLSMIENKNLDAADTLPELFIVHQSYKERVHIGATMALVILNVTDNVPVLLKLLKTKNSRIQKNMIKVLGELKAKEAIPVLLKLLKTKNSQIQKNVIKVLGELKAKEAIPDLVSMLQIETENTQIQRSVIEVLGELKAKEAIPDLVSMLQIETENTQIQRSVIEVLGELKAKEAIPVLLKLLKTKNSQIQKNVIKVLGELKAKEAIPDLINILQIENENTDQLIKSLETIFIYSDCGHVVEDLLKLTNHPHADKRYLAIIVLAKIGDGRAIERLGSLLSDQSPVSKKLTDSKKEYYVSNAALSALEKIGTPQAKKIVDNWRKSQNDE